MTYILRSPERVALAALARQTSGIRAALLEGPPGCGKTALAGHLAAETGAEEIYDLLHSWSDDQTLFAGVDVAAAVAGDAAGVHRPGVLALAADSTPSISEVLDEIGRPVRTCVALGDWDAGDHFRSLVESGTDLYWLDSYCCSSGEPRPASRTLRAPAAAWSRQPKGWYQGVGDAESTIIALRAMS